LPVLLEVATAVGGHWTQLPAALIIDTSSHHL